MARGRLTPGSRWWRGTTVAAVLLLLVTGILAGTALVPGFRDGGPPTVSGGPGPAVLIDGRLVITNPDGTLTVIDTSTLGIAAETTEVLLAGGTLYLADRTAGTIGRLDPVTGSFVGSVWTAGGRLASAAIDDTGTVWALRADGLLHRLAWTEDRLDLAGDPIRATGAGAASTLVAHPAGVTVLSPEAGIAVRVGTDSDGTVRLPRRTGLVRAPRSSPVDLVPAAFDGTTILLLITGNDAILVDTEPYDCRRPDRPAVHTGHVYVPCRGAGRVIVLDAAGTHAPPDIDLGAPGDPIIVVGGDQLYTALPGAREGIVVAADRATTTFTTTNSPIAAQNAAGQGGTPVVGTVAGGTGTGTDAGAGTGGTGTGTGSGIGTGGTGTGDGGAASPSESPSPSPPAVPRDGDPVVTGYHEEPVCSPSFSFCKFYRYEYTVLLNPPPSWRDFTGTCRLHIERPNGPIEQAIGCGATSAPMGNGTGAIHTVSVLACAATCVTSNRFDVPTNPPEQSMCGDYLC